MRRFLASLFVVALIAGCAEAPETAETTVTTGATATTTPLAPVDTTGPEDGRRTITVGGIGTRYAAPTRSIVDLAVTARRATVVDASKAATDAGEAMLAALTAAGVEPEQIQTSEFSVGPYYDQWPMVAGYEVTIGYRVTVPDVDRVGAILGRAIAAGGDNARAWGLRFEADHEELMGAARTEAWADVRMRAEALARLAGEPLGRVLDIHEKVLLSNSAGMVQGGEGDSAAFDIPASPGVAGVVVLLTVTYEIGG